MLDLSLPGCPITPTDLIRNYSGRPVRTSPVRRLDEEFPPRMRNFKPDVSLVFLSVMEETDQRTCNGGWNNLMDPGYRKYQEGASTSSSLLTKPAPGPVGGRPYFKFQIDLPFISDNPARTDELNVMYRELAAQHQNVKLIDYAAQLNRPGH